MIKISCLFITDHQFHFYFAAYLHFSLCPFFFKKTHEAKIKMHSRRNRNRKPLQQPATAHSTATGACGQFQLLAP
jgi:hypothetical protein